ncbi:MAG: hypothetical protein Fur0025_15170 [Oscillatoriaceae cyanobacterium]
MNRDVESFTDRHLSGSLQESIFAEALGIGDEATSASTIPASSDGEENIARSGQSDAPEETAPPAPVALETGRLPDHQFLMGGSQGDLDGLSESTANPARCNFSIDSVEPEVTGEREIAGEGDGYLPSGGDRLEKKHNTKLGEIPAVQERYYALLKRRLKTEIQQHPPKFPWETDDIFDYEAEILDYSAGEIVPTKRVWLPQLHSLNLPVALPEQILAQLLALTNQLIDSSLREGEMLVRAVESLFPGQTDQLNNLARLMLAAPARSAATGGERLSKTALGLPDRYDDANPTQQMLLSMLAAREMVGAMTINLSPSGSCQERQWLTAAGMLKLKVNYEDQSLKVRACLPDGGRLSLSGNEQVQMAQQEQQGWVSLELGAPEPEQTYFLEIQLASGDDFERLTFAISMTAPEF